MQIGMVLINAQNTATLPSKMLPEFCRYPRLFKRRPAYDNILACKENIPHIDSAEQRSILRT